jgi:hypothetical protein
MSLKYFHIFFIFVSILLSFFFGFWSLENYYIGETMSLPFAVLGFVSGFALMFYGRSVWKKLKGIGFFTFAMVLFLARDVFACATCYIDPSQPEARALTASVLCLLLIVITVLAGFLALIVYYNKRVKTLEKNVL